MPLYDYRCVVCRRRHTAFRRIDDRRDGPECCGEKTELLISCPRVKRWDPDWKFPNLTHKGDGSMSFESEAAYHEYLETAFDWGPVREVAGPDIKGSGRRHRKIYGPKPTPGPEPEAW